MSSERNPQINPSPVIISSVTDYRISMYYKVLLGIRVVKEELKLSCLITERSS